MNRSHSLLVTRYSLLRRGFTLIELLIALTITALIVAAMSSTFHALVTTQKAAASSSAEDRVARTVMDRLSRELVSACRWTDTPAVLSSKSDASDGIVIWTLAYGAPRKVEYYWQDDALWRRETDPTRTDPSEPARLTGVTNLGLRYHDGKTWADAWSAPGAPAGVAVELRMGRIVYGSIVTL